MATSMASALGVLVLGLVVVLPLQAADRTWNNTGTDYNAGPSWGGTAPGSSDAAVFNAAATNQPNLSGSITNQQVRFSVAVASGYTLSASAGKTLTLTSTGTGTNAGSGAALVFANAGGTNMIAAPVVLGAAGGSTQTFDTDGDGGTTLVSGNISELNSGIKLRVQGASSAILGLSGSNSFSGGITVNAGKLVLDYTNNATVVNSANTLTLGGGTLELKATSAIASTQALGNLTLTDNTQNRIELVPNGGTMALILGNTWTRATAAVHLDLPTGTELTSLPVLANDLLMYAVVEDALDIGFATTNAVGKVVRYTYVPAQQLSANPSFSNTTNLYLAGSLTMSGGSTVAPICGTIISDL